ncbi:ParE-like toxin of type II ParDE toxin-antitoxin system [Mucilaginibacter gracilis]|uniref:ParE-like toxin of type II ParDE toxin-antitoxin system n=1 Tax=Mucilaginibacter gracilis TaxID=423350 RepID=A0A495J1U2_9SPHI|nr:type II toxin-antitoxin system RelE/ParE family toxin [Mucilaginibacter gracilis]RKR82682.1 ParE-like toxin of type II ParDE toxin-antitoxin system [Mucilaginibacter gracilis]
MYQIVIKPKAVDMARDAYVWYELQQPGLGELFLKELDNCYDKLEAWPIAYAKIRKNFRQIILKKFPYVLVFEIIKHEVVIYAVFHTSLSPRKKFKR